MSTNAEQPKTTDAQAVWEWLREPDWSKDFDLLSWINRRPLLEAHRLLALDAQVARIDAWAFVCPRCGAVSHHPKDIEHGYCGRCHDWTGPPASDSQSTPR